MNSREPFETSIEGDARSLEVLLIEDNPGDARLMIEGLKTSNTRHNLSIVSDGVDAMAFLNRKGSYADAPRPDLVLLDLNLPRKDGREVLAEIKSDVRLRRIPVVVLTTSRADEDIVKSYDLHANGYITKPVNLDEFLVVVKAIQDFWLAAATLPKH